MKSVIVCAITLFMTTSTATAAAGSNGGPAPRALWAEVANALGFPAQNHPWSHTEVSLASWEACRKDCKQNCESFSPFKPQGLNHDCDYKCTREHCNKLRPPPPPPTTCSSDVECPFLRQALDRFGDRDRHACAPATGPADGPTAGGKGVCTWPAELLEAMSGPSREWLETGCGHRRRSRRSLRGAGDRRLVVGCFNEEHERPQARVTVPIGRAGF